MSLMYGLVDFVECGHYLSRYCFLPFFLFWESCHMRASQVPAVLTFLSLLLLSVPRLCISVFHLPVHWLLSLLVQTCYQTLQ